MYNHRCYIFIQSIRNFKLILKGILFLYLLFSPIIYAQEYTDSKTREIIWKAVERKKKLQEELKNFVYTSYTKSVSRNTGGPNDITMICEYHTVFRYSNGIFSKEVCGFRQAGEIGIIWNPDLLTITLVDKLKFGNLRVITPLGKDTFDFYKYFFKGKIVIKNKQVYEIEIEPLSEEIPLIKGSLFIVDEDFSVVGLEFSFNKAVKFPGTIKNLQFKQEFALFFEKFWLPIEQKASGEFLIRSQSIYNEKPLLSNFGVSENVIMVYDHKINKIDSYKTFLNDFETLKESVEDMETGYLSSIGKPLTQEEENAFIVLPPKFRYFHQIYSAFEK